MSENTQKPFTIMVAIDGSETSMRAAEYAVAMTKNIKNEQTQLIGITILDLGRLSYSFFVAAPSYGSKELEEKRQEAKMWLNRVDQLSKENSVPQFKSEIIEDVVSRIGGAIVKYAENEKVDLIVVGTRGRSSLKRMLIGSVASDILHYAHCPVMIVK
ncbi:MAG TPA: universal stress protein [Bacillus sp. (in: firmicutes)]|jgi:nucleotide-binding universal stress UspA family protein|nr:universal stress protein [Bacillus sp. (in: firmicutes)]